MIGNSLHKIVVIIVLGISVVFFIRFGSKSTTLYGDALGYYMYLPATFIYHNLTNMSELPADKGIDKQIMLSARGTTGRQRTPTGKILNGYTYGVAFMELPFFMIAHIMEKAGGKEANGYSDTCQMLIKLSALVYGLLGLLLVYKILKMYFTPAHALLAVSVLFAGTNLFWFTLHQAGMSHMPLFFLWALLMYQVIRLHERPGFMAFILCGFIAGLITIMRPSDVVCLLIPLLYGVYNKETLKGKSGFLMDNKLGLVLFVVAFILPVIPQLLYWKATTGHYLFYSYGDQGFNWRHPKIREGLFYFSNGWLPYGPVMIFALAGFVLRRSYKRWYWCLWLLFPVYVYIIYSWYCFNYINGYGSRPMIHMYPLLALPLAAFIGYIARQRLAVRVGVIVAGIVFSIINLDFCRLQAMGLLKSEESNMAYNFQIFFRDKLTYDDLIVNDVGEWQPAPSSISLMRTLACNNFNDSTSVQYVRDTVMKGGYVYQMRHEDYSPELSLRYNHEQYKGARWLKCSGRFMYPFVPDYFKHFLVLDIPGKAWKGCKIENKTDSASGNYSLNYYKTGQWGYVYFYTRIPAGMKDGDVIKLFVWNYARTDIYMDDLKVELYR